MTFSYSYRVTSVRLFGLGRLLTIWRASVYKLVFTELLIFSLLYAVATCVYRFALAKSQRKLFEKTVVYCGTFESFLPVTFVLGFYVSVVVQRWWAQFMNIPWPDRIMSYISVLIPGQDETTIMLRRTIIRYLLLSEVLLLMAVSAPIKKRFPDVQSLVQQGLMTKEEYEMYNDENVPHISSKYWLPTHWCAMLLGRARREKRIRDNFSLSVLLNELSTYKGCLGTIVSYDWISLPLVYTQVATIAVYGFFFNTILSRQYLDHTSVREDFGLEVSAKFALDLYVPVDTLLQLFFYLGWLKVAEQMLNPFGEDDDDFECNFIVDRNLKVGLYAVDQMLVKEPTLQRDAWWSSRDPQLNYTLASEKFAMADGWFGSTANITVPAQEMPSGGGTHPRLPCISEVSATAAATYSTDARGEMCDVEEEADDEECVLSGDSSPREFKAAGAANLDDRGTLESPTDAAKGNRRLPPLLEELKKPFASAKRCPRRRTRTTTIESQLRALGGSANTESGLHSPSSMVCHSLPDAQFRFALAASASGRKIPGDAGAVGEGEGVAVELLQRVTEVAEVAADGFGRRRRVRKAPDEVDGGASVETPLLQVGPEESGQSGNEGMTLTAVKGNTGNGGDGGGEGEGEGGGKSGSRVSNWLSDHEFASTGNRPNLLSGLSSSACNLRQQQQQQQQPSVDLPVDTDSTVGAAGADAESLQQQRRRVVAFNPEVDSVEFHASRPAVDVSAEADTDGGGGCHSDRTSGADSASCLSGCSEDAA